MRHEIPHDRASRSSYSNLPRNHSPLVQRRGEMRSTIITITGSSNRPGGGHFSDRDPGADLLLRGGGSISDWKRLKSGGKGRKTNLGITTRPSPLDIIEGRDW